MKSDLNNKHILITGATGLIGQNLINYLQVAVPSCHIIALVHSLEKAKVIFKDCGCLTFVEADVNNHIIYDGEVDYIIHGANITSSKKFVEVPVDTIMTAINGTKNLLDLARVKQVESFVYLSTMEVYGLPTSDKKITEDYVCNLDPMQTRSSYPESKRLCENLCQSYYAQFGVPTKVVRLTQTIGPGIEYNDGRVFAEFARCAVEKRDIVLHTKGLTKRVYISSDDAVKAILIVLLNGGNGEAYNAANESTYCSIYDMAHLVADVICGENIKVLIDEVDINKYGYAPTLKMNLDTTKIRSIGWRAEDSLEKMYNDLIQYLTNIR